MHSSQLKMPILKNDNRLKPIMDKMSLYGFAVAIGYYWYLLGFLIPILNGEKNIVP